MYAKLFSSITESSLWSEPKEVRLLFVTMLAKADQMGFVEASIPGLARVANLTIEETERSLECLQSPDKYSKNPENEGRRVMVVPGGFVLLNYEDYRARRSTEERREYMREYMREYRKPAVNDVKRGKPQLAQAEAEAEAEAKKKTRKSSSSQSTMHESVLSTFNAAFGCNCRLTDSRKKALNARLGDDWWADHWKEAIEIGSKSPFLRGENDRGWKIDFEFFLKPETVTKIIEGKYSPVQPKKKDPFPFDLNNPASKAELEKLFLDGLHT